MLSKKFGVVMLVAGILEVVVTRFLKQANQPVYVSSSLGSGYMTDGWGDALPMFNAIMVAGVIMAVIGLIMLIAAKK